MIPANFNNYVKMHVEGITENEHCAISFNYSIMLPHIRKRRAYKSSNPRSKNTSRCSSRLTCCFFLQPICVSLKILNSDLSSESERNGVVQLQDRRPDPRSRAAPLTRPIFAPEHTQRANDMSTIQASPNTPEVFYLFFFLAR